MKNPRRWSARTVLANAASTWTTNSVHLVMAFVMSPIMVRGLGDQRYGVWSVVESALAYLALFDLGISASIVRNIARFDEIDDERRLKGAYSTSLLIFSIAAAAVLAIALGMAIAWRHPFGLEGELARDARWLLALFGIRLALSLPFGVYGAALEGLARYQLKSAIKLVFLLGGSAVFLIVLLEGGGIVALALTNVIGVLAEQICLAVVLRHYAPQMRFSWRDVDRESFHNIRGYSANAFVALLAGHISFRTDALVIGSFMDMRFVTYFGLAAKLIDYAKTSLYSAVTVLTPQISAMEARGDEDGIRRVLIRATRYVLLLMTPVQVGFVMLGRSFLNVWMRDPAYGDECYPTLVILSIPFALTVSQAISGRILYGTGRLGWFARMTMLEAVLNLIMSLILVQRFGVQGVAWGTTIPNFIFNASLAVYVCRMFSVPISQYLRQSFLGPVLLNVIPAVVWLALVNAMPIANWLSFVLVGSAGVAAYALVAIPAEFGFAGTRQLIETATRRLLSYVGYRNAPAVLASGDEIAKSLQVSEVRN